MANENSIYLNMLIQSLQLLAAPYEQQLQTLPLFVHIPDEIALTFDEVYHHVDKLAKMNLVTPHQKEDLEQMDLMLDKMSDNKDLWSLDALKLSSDWKQVRLLATKLLASFNEPKQPPDLFWLQYIPDKKT